MSYSLKFEQKNSLVYDFAKDNIEEKILKLIQDRTLSSKNINKSINSNKDSITIKNFFDDNMRVKDIYRYKINISSKLYPTLIKHKNSSFASSKFEDLDVINDKNINSIILLLESPHRYEYEYDVSSQSYKPIAPAQGETGKRIEGNICILINELISNPKYNFHLKDGEYRLIICNPVQYQSSLYYLHGKGIFNGLRDDIWSEIFKQSKVKENFLERIKSYKPELILNGCTKECGEKVNEFINEKIPNIKYYKTSHPFNWGGFNIE